MFKNKKQKNKLLKNFKTNQKFFVAIFLVFVLSASAFTSLYYSYRSLNFLTCGYLGSQASASQAQQFSSEELIKRYQKLSLYEDHIRSNMSLIAPDYSDLVIIDGISFIHDDRALIFYHNQIKNFISEVVLSFKDKDNFEIVKIYLKNSGNDDYSQGVYGADPD